MSRDPIVEELHRFREELYREVGNDPAALVRFLQEQERVSGRLVEAPEPGRAAARGPEPGPGRTPRP
jgi:hypothetical protein